MTNPTFQSQSPEKLLIGYDSFLSPYSHRYGSKEMRRIWSQNSFWGRVRDVWIAAAEVQHDVGLVSDGQLADLKAHRGELSVERIFQLEKEKGHDVAGAIAEYSEKAPVGGEILHQGMTSEDPLSNAEISQTRDSLGLIRSRLVTTLEAFAGQIDRHKDLVCMGWTHLQAAEPITLGYRLARYAQDLLIDLRNIDNTTAIVQGKGIKGAVGTSASFQEMLAGTGMTPAEHERKIMEKLGLGSVTISDQTYPRKFLFQTETTLAGIGASLHHWALDLQLLQSSTVDELAEPRRKGQIGSSAMPHKQNPIGAENVGSLTQTLPGYLESAWLTAATVTLERTLRDSAGKRDWLPASFLVVDEALSRTARIVSGLVVHEDSIRRNLEHFGPFCATELILGQLVRSGMDRKEAHEILVGHAETAVDATRRGEPNPMKQLVFGDSRIVSRLGQPAVDKAFKDILTHVGDAPQRCTAFLENELYPAIRGNR